MRAVNIADLKNNLSRYLSAVRRGEELIVKDRNQAIASNAGRRAHNTRALIPFGFSPAGKRFR